MQNSTPEIAVAIRTFGNSKMQEGLRVKAGTRFAVGKPQGGLQLLTPARYRQLLAARLVRPLGAEDAAAAPSAGDPSKKRPVDAHAADAIEQNEAEAAANEKPKEPMRRPSARAAARRRTQEADPPAPRLIRPASQPAAAPVGSPNGSPAPASSSAAGPASSTSSTSSRPRGRRRGSAG